MGRTVGWSAGLGGLVLHSVCCSHRGSSCPRLLRHPTQCPRQHLLYARKGQESTGAEPEFIPATGSSSEAKHQYAPQCMISSFLRSSCYFPHIRSIFHTPSAANPSLTTTPADPFCFSVANPFLLSSTLTNDREGCAPHFSRRIDVRTLSAP